MVATLLNLLVCKTSFAGSPNVPLTIDNINMELYVEYHLHFLAEVTSKKHPIKSYQDQGNNKHKEAVA